MEICILEFSIDLSQKLISEITDSVNHFIKDDLNLFDGLMWLIDFLIKFFV